MTEKSDPSIPATATTTSARSISSSLDRSRRIPATPTSGTIEAATPRYSSVRRHSSAARMSIVPAVTMHTVPSVFAIGFPTER